MSAGEEALLREETRGSEQEGPTHFHRRNLGSGDRNRRNDYISEANLQLLEWRH